MADRNTKIKASQIFNNGVLLEDLNEEVKVASIGVVFDNNGSEITVGSEVDVEIPYNCTITNVTMLSDVTGSLIIDILKNTYTSFPPVASITASAIPTISASNKSKDNTLSGWTTDISAGDILRFSVTSSATITRCLINLTVLRT